MSHRKHFEGGGKSHSSEDSKVRDHRSTKISVISDAMAGILNQVAEMSWDMDGLTSLSSNHGTMFTELQVALASDIDKTPPVPFSLMLSEAKSEDNRNGKILNAFSHLTSAFCVKLPRMGSMAKNDGVHT